METGLKQRRMIVPLLALGALALALAGFATLYGRKGQEAKLGLAAQAQDTACPDALAATPRITTFAKGEVAALMLPKVPALMPDIQFAGADGVLHKLGDYRGRTVLLNLWATWCIPCREEMPALDRLQQSLGSAEFEVVAVNIDTARLEKRQAFLDSVGVKSLTFYADAKADAFQLLKSAGRVEGLPTTWLIGKDGCEIGTLAAKADWGSADAAALVRAALR